MGWIADLLKEIPSAARYKSELEQLESEHEIAQRKIADLEAEKSILQTKLTTAEEKIRNLEEQLSTRSGDRLEPLKERILNLLVSRPHLTSPLIAQELKTNPETIKFHLEEMKQSRLVHDEDHHRNRESLRRMDSPPPDWKLNLCHLSPVLSLCE